jgi:hypothetical protein
MHESVMSNFTNKKLVSRMEISYKKVTMIQKISFIY